MNTPRFIQPAVNYSQIPADIFLIYDAFRSHSETRLHSHNWGQLQLVSGGMLELNAHGERFLAPSKHAIWVPAGIVHQSYNRKPISYCAINIVQPLAKYLPDKPCLLTVTPIVEVIIDNLRERKIQVAEIEQDKRLVEVLYDQLCSAQQIEHFLPTSRDKLLLPILSALESDPADPRNLHEWANFVHTTERTLARHCKSELGISFTEWRLRMRYLYSLELLKQGGSIKEIAFMLGYNQASPFITMFKKYAQCTPEFYKLKHSL
jgi:AraC-like DNA-binding protein